MAGRVERRIRPAAAPGYWRRHVRKESVRNTGSPKAWSAMTNRTPARDRSGALGWRRGSQYRGSRVTPVEGRDLSSRQTQQVVRDLEIGQPINSENCSETAEGVARESEGRSRLSLLRPVRQDQPRGHPGACLCPVPLQQGRAGGGWSGLCGHRGVRGAAVARRTGACSQARGLPTGPHQKSVYPEGQRQTPATGHLNPARSGVHDSSDASARTDLRSRPSTRAVRLPSWEKCPAGGGRGGELLFRGHPDVVDADLADYFGSIPHTELLKSVTRRIVDRRVLHLIKMWLECPVEETDDRGRKTRTTEARDNRRGIPQGSPISP